MKRFAYALTICLLAFFLMGATSCQTTDTVILPEGPKATELNKAKDQQIAGLAAQVKAEQEARVLEQGLASKAASNIKGILKAKDYLDPSPPVDAIKAEGELGLQRLPADDPAETVKALERVVLIVTGQRDEAQRLYREADAQTKLERAAKEAKDKDIAARDAIIKTGEADIVRLTQEKADEQAAHVKDVKAAFAKKDAEIIQIKKDFASKERATWVLWTRIAGLGFIVIGAVIAIVFKVIPEGASFVGVGVVIGLVSIFIDWLTAQVWFPWLCGGIILLVLVAGGYALYRMWQTHTLHAKLTAAMQDLKDEATTKGTDLWQQVSEHLNYRLGDKTSYWGGVQAKTVAALGLVNPKAETEVKPAAPPSTGG